MSQFEKEKAKYEAAYKKPGYQMGEKRKHHATQIINTWNSEGLTKSFLDVGGGRGELLEYAKRKGFHTCGTEIVSYLVNPDKNIVYAEADNLPFADNSFDYLTCLDVIEHLIPGVEIPVFKEFKRVARERILMTIANFPSRGLKGVELHINIKPYQEWDDILRDIFSDDIVIWHPKKGNISETWEIILA
jgi:ubiquinone/menaquinone biosynthesis C-methylase UbiE